MDKLAELQGRYEAMEGGQCPPFHYGSHYSHSGAVLYYLVRLEPYATLLLEWQGGCWDVPDRMFHSVPETFASVFRCVPRDNPARYPNFRTPMEKWGQQESGTWVSRRIFLHFSSPPPFFAVFLRGYSCNFYCDLMMTHPPFPPISAPFPHLSHFSKASSGTRGLGYLGALLDGGVTGLLCEAAWLGCSNCKSNPLSYLPTGRNWRAPSSSLQIQCT